MSMDREEIVLPWDDDFEPYQMTCNHVEPHTWWVMDLEEQAGLMLFTLAGWDRLWCWGDMPEWLRHRFPMAPELQT